jgi:hypothetical protein
LFRWARIEAFGNEASSGEIPTYHRTAPPSEALQQLAAFIQRVYDAGLKTQDYDKGCDRFVRKFDSEVEVSAIVAILKGFHADHGTAVHLTQEKRRCLLLNMTYGLTDDEALSATRASWASFQPRRAKPRVPPGPFYYPAGCSHVFEKY